jgi:undecaprenyl-diphosphatase
MRRLSIAANYSRLSIAAALVLATAGGARGQRAASNGLVSVAVTSAVVNLGIKPLGRRRRPASLAPPVPDARRLPMPRSSAFPSGHSASAFAFATGVGSSLPWAAAPLRVLAAVVGYSRVHTGVHYPADVVAGSVLGAAVAQVTTHMIESLA